MTRAHAEVDVIALHAAMSALAPVAHLAAAGGLRALPAAPRDGQTGGGDPQSWVDRLHDRGDLARARLAHRRLLLVHPRPRAVLLWLADRGDARPSVREASVLLAREVGPVLLRIAADLATARREETERAHARSARASGKALTEGAARLRDLLVMRRAVEERCEARLADWGRSVLASALAAWRATEGGGGEAPRNASASAAGPCECPGDIGECPLRPPPSGAPTRRLDRCGAGRWRASVTLSQRVTCHGNSCPLLARPAADAYLSHTPRRSHR